MTTDDAVQAARDGVQAAAGDWGVPDSVLDSYEQAIRADEAQRGTDDDDINAVLRAVLHPGNPCGHSWVRPCEHEEAKVREAIRKYGIEQVAPYAEVLRRCRKGIPFSSSVIAVDVDALLAEYDTALQAAEQEMG